MRAIKVMDTIQSLHTRPTHSVERALPGVSVETVAYLALVLLALVLRVAQLDRIPFSEPEARQALAAWRVVDPAAAGGDIVPESPLLFALHALSFSVLGASELSARLPTLVGGMLLILLPLLFRSWFGRARSFLFSLLLTFSPVLLISTRQGSPVVWSLLLAGVGLWAVLRYRESGRSGYAMGAMVCTAALAFLTDPTGPFLLLALVVASAATFPYVLRNAKGDSAWPVLNGVLVSLLVVFTVATLFMTYPPGLSAIGELWNAALRGLSVPRPDVPLAFPLMIVLFYEPLALVLGIGAVVWAVRQDRWNEGDRFLTALAAVGAVWGALYVGAGAEHALWIVVPLLALGSGLLVRLFPRSEDALWWAVPSWGKWLVALIMVALLCMFAIHAQTLARSLLTAPDPFQFTAVNSLSLVWVIIIVLFVIIGYFLSASVWGVGATTQGLLLGLTGFLLVTSLGSGWRAAAERSTDPVELWNRRAIGGETAALRSTLHEIAKRETSGFRDLTVYAQVPEDGVVAWLLRDYPHTVFVTDPGAARAEGVVILPTAQELPDLGGAYVGDSFTITRTWGGLRELRLLDLPAWWLQMRSRTGGFAAVDVTLWLRQDIYDGVPFDINQ